MPPRLFYYTEVSIVLGFDLEEGLRMRADRAYLRGFFAEFDVSAVTADPQLVTVTAEYDRILDVVEQLAVAFLMVTFYLSHFAHLFCDLRESLFIGGLCHLGVHICPLVVFSIGCVRQIVKR